MWRNLVSDIFNFSLVACYALLFIVALVLYVRRFKKSIFNSTVFIVTFQLGVMIRGTYFGLSPFLEEDKIQLRNSIVFLVNTSPTFFFFCTYMVLFLMWGELYTSSYNRSSSFKLHDGASTRNRASSTTLTLRIVLIAVNVLLLVGVGVIYGLDLWSDTGDRVEFTLAQKILICIASSMYIITPFCFFIYGYFVYKNNFYENMGIIRSARQKSVLRRVGLLSFMCILCFLIRAIVTLLQLKVNLADTAWEVSIYFFFLEVLPLSLMLFVLNAATQPHATKPVSTNINSSSPGMMTPLIT